jgi:hypothetical protein
LPGNGGYLKKSLKSRLLSEDIKQSLTGFFLV